jgi:hypothetical protein
MCLEFLLRDEDEDRLRLPVISFIFAVTSVTGVTFPILRKVLVQLNDLELIRPADARLLDRLLDLVRVELGDVGDFCEGERLEFAGLQVDDLVAAHWVDNSVIFIMKMKITEMDRAIIRRLN